MDVVVSNFRTFAAVLKVVVAMVVVAVASVAAHPSRQHNDYHYYQHEQRGGRFDPYSLDGGLVTAIAGKGYVLIASDTRLSDGGYNVRTRGHLSSRLWIAGPIPPLLTTTTTNTNTRHRRRLSTRRRYALEGADGEEGEGMARRKGGGTNGAYDDNDEEGEEEEEGNDGEEGEDDAFPISADGSIVIPSTEAEVPCVASDSSSSPPPLKLAGAHPRRYIVPDVSSVTFVGSSGCSADCESLKRSLRSEMTCRARWVSPSSSESGLRSISGSRFSFGMHSSTARSTATALMQTLYSRRTFPYYSFCVLAGMDDIITCDAHGNGNGNDDGDGDGDVNDKARRYEGGQGRVHVYDAIGSHERCAAACAGAPGREMLQPILDRLFSSCASSSTSSLYSPHSSSSSSAMAAAATKSALRRDGKYVPPESQRIGSLSLGPPVASCVDCNAEEAVARIVKAYRSVSEREIGIGDDLVVCVLRANGASNKNVTKDKRGDEDRSGTLQVLRFPLKKH